MIYIYILIDPTTNEIKYCGKTGNLKERFSSHMKDRKPIEKYNWIKNLKDNNLKPIMEIIDEVEIEDWDFWEKYWIAQLKCWGFQLLNKTNGGGFGVTGYRHTDEAKRIISQKQIGRKANDEWRRRISIGRKGIKFSEEHLKNLSTSHIGQQSSSKISVYQIDIKSGKILNKFQSIMESSIYVGATRKTNLISKVCKGKLKSAYGYYWCYSDDYDNYKFETYYRIYNPIYQYDKNGNLIKEYSNIYTAAKENELKQASISHALNEDPSCGGFIWLYKSDDIKILYEKLKRVKQDYTLNQIDMKTGEIVETYESIKEAEQKTKIKHISCVLAGKRKSAGNYFWKKV